MLLIISPSKTQNFKPSASAPYTTPTLLKHSCLLIRHLQKLDRDQVGKLLKTSPKLSQSSWNNFQNFHTPFTDKNAKQALLTFEGEVFRGIETEQYTEDDFQFAQQHLRILSGLYGILKPLDLMQPYRLEMATALECGKAKNLYSFWRKMLTDEINNTLASCHDQVLINLASQEYFKALDKKKLTGKVVDIAFKEMKNGTYKTIAIHAKRARGKMVNFIIKNRITKVAELSSFSEGGYSLNKKLSSSSSRVFCRE